MGGSEQISIQREDFDLAMEYEKLRVEIGNEVGAIVSFTGIVREQLLSEKTEERINYKILGYFENGFRQISNKIRPIYTPDDFCKMSIRVLPSDVQARTFELLGASPKRLDLTEAIAGIVDGSLDAQENPMLKLMVRNLTSLSFPI